MARLLARLGGFSARRPWLVIITWVVALAVAGGAYLIAGGKLASGFSIPNTTTQQVTDRLAEKIDGVGGAVGTVVFQTEDGSPFTDEQRQAIADAIDEVSDYPHVARVVDPFATADELAEQEQKLADARQEIEDGRQKIEDGRQEIADGWEQVTDGRKKIADGRKQVADGRKKIADGRAQVADGRRQLDAAQKQVDAGQKELDAARAEAEEAGVIDVVGPQLDAQQKELDAAQAQIDAKRAALRQAAAELDRGARELDQAEKDLDRAEKDLAQAVTDLEQGEKDLDQAVIDLEEGERKLELGAALFEHAREIVTVSRSGSTALGAVVFDLTLFDLDPNDRTAVADALVDAHIPGVTLEFSSELVASLAGVFGVGEAAGVLIAFIVLIIVFGALLPAVLPLVSSVIGVGVGVAGSLAFSGVIEMASVTPVLGVMLGLAVGIDYTLFIINRHRRQLREGVALKDSIPLANGTAGNAVVFAGSTVFIALLALNITGIPFLGVMGTVAAICVLVAVLVAITLAPALLSLVGLRVLPRKQRAAIGQAALVAPTPKAMPTWRAVVSAVLAIGVLLVAAIPALSLRLNLPDGGSESPDSTEYKAYTAVAEEFGAGRNGTLVVTAEPATAVDPDDEDAVMELQVEVSDLLVGVDGISAIAPVGVSDDGELLAFQIIPVDGPTTESTEKLVHALRALSPVQTELGTTVLGVAGQAAANIDISEALAEALPVYLAVVIGLSVLIMIVVFRSLLVPIIATGGFLLSYFAALGAVTAIYQWGWLSEVFGVHHPGPVLNFAPVILVGVLFGLAMDYQLFIASGMREAFVHGTPARVAVGVGVQGARAVVIAAAIIMISVFGGFVFSHLAMIRPLGFGLAVGVLFDAFVVRLLLMPALMHLLGRAAWWMPKWLDRILPDVDVEGASLERPALPAGTHAVRPAARRALATPAPEKERAGTTS